MMEYIPGRIHEKLQKEFYFRCDKEFIWIACSKRYKLFESQNDWDKHTFDIELKVGDIIVIRFWNTEIKGNPNFYSDTHTYIERVISGDSIIEYKTESIVSKNFVEANFGIGDYLLTDVTKSFEREKKIDSILEY
jgi:hypothetical protein